MRIVNPSMTLNLSFGLFFVCTHSIEDLKCINRFSVVFHDVFFFHFKVCFSYLAEYIISFNHFFYRKTYKEKSEQLII
ncbi:Uncharacterized protein APZ42_005578 [Daphnia magna]|uniref:Uncharacterized protein n=1 Tax=Daphnia magna TaxID=35525 RepID=A0A162CT59_9CRUS|nr:Uncharacterized protein APZ42_005578 [Daphnia magna]